MPEAQRDYQKDYYKVLGVPSSATEKDITRAYRKLAKQHHPDANPGSEDRFKEISVAYDVLGDPAKRKEYDEIRRLGPVGGMFGGGNGRGPAGFNVNIDDLGDLFGGLFNRGRGRGGAAGPRRGDDLEASLHLSFVDAISGITTTVNVVSDAPCTTCNGSGAKPGTSPVICSTCGGRGVVDDNQGMFSFSQACRDCRGTGMRVETPCEKCRGSGIERRPRQVKVRIPPGVDEGQRIRLKGRGAVGANGGPAGDLYVLVHVDKHPIFGRKGKHLTVAAPITFAEAALGATITVPTLTKPVSLRIPPGTRSGQTFRAKGHGVPLASGPGDLLVTVEVDVPTHLTPEQRQAIEALGATITESPRKALGVT